MSKTLLLMTLVLFTATSFSQTVTGNLSLSGHTKILLYAGETAAFSLPRLLKSNRLKNFCKTAEIFSNVIAGLDDEIVQAEVAKQNRFWTSRNIDFSIDEIAVLKELCDKKTLETNLKTTQEAADKIAFNMTLE